MNNKSLPYPWIIAIVAAVFFIPFLGHVHLFDWDEINFAESSREMIVTGDYARVTVGFRPFWEKPPLFFWLQASAMHVFGVNEFSARLPNALIGIITLLTLFYIGKKERNERFGVIWGSIYFASLLTSVQESGTSGVMLRAAKPTISFTLFLLLTEMST